MIFSLKILKNYIARCDFWSWRHFVARLFYRLLFFFISLLIFAFIPLPFKYGRILIHLPSATIIWSSIFIPAKKAYAPKPVS